MMSSTDRDQHAAQLSRDGFTILAAVFDSEEVDSLASRLITTLEGLSDPAVLRSRGRTYGSRNLLEAVPEILNLLHRPLLSEFATDILGRDAGVVRALFFDKPPGRSWSLPWHRDLTIAVDNNERPSESFRNPTLKAGVPHVEAPAWLLNEMLTLRVHLDPMTTENGPLWVIPGSHVGNDSNPEHPMELSAAAGDVLAMRPLLSHSSTMSHPETTAHRRVIHIELAGTRVLPDGYKWHSFFPLPDDSALSS